MGQFVKYHPVRGGVFGGVSADPGRGFALGAAAVPGGRHGCAAGLHWVQISGHGRGGGGGIDVTHRSRLL